MTSHRTVSLACVALLLGGCLTVTARGADQEALRFKFKEGEKLRYTTESRTTAEFTLSGETVKHDSILAFDVTWEVTRIDKDGRASITSTLDRVRFSTDTPGGKKSFDTKDGRKPDDELLKLMAKPLTVLLGRRVTFEVDARGQVEKLKPSEEVEKALKGGNVFVAGVVRVLSGWPLVLPDEAPKKGVSWSQKAHTTFPSAGPTTLELKFTYEGPVERGGRQVEKISIKVAGSADKPPPGTKVDFKGGDGVAYFDRATGRAIEVSTTQKLEVEEKVGEKVSTKKGTVTTTTKPAEPEKP